MAKIKYLGSADVARLEKGENFSGRLATPLSKDVEFTAANNHLIDTDEAGLSAEAVELILEDKDRFRDVTNLKKIPTSLNEQIFRGLGKNKDNDDEAEADVPVVPVGGQSVEPGSTPTPATAPATTTPARSTSGRG